MNSVVFFLDFFLGGEGGIFRALLFEKYFFGCSISGKVFFWVVQKYPTPLIPLCKFIKSTWDKCP